MSDEFTGLGHIMDRAKAINEARERERLAARAMFDETTARERIVNNVSDACLDALQAYDEAREAVDRLEGEGNG